VRLIGHSSLGEEQLDASIYRSWDEAANCSRVRIGAEIGGPAASACYRAAFGPTEESGKSNPALLKDSLGARVLGLDHAGDFDSRLRALSGARGRKRPGCEMKLSSGIRGLPDIARISGAVYGRD